MVYVAQSHRPLRLAVLESFFATDEGIRQEQGWSESRREIVDGIVSLVFTLKDFRGARAAN